MISGDFSAKFPAFGLSKVWLHPSIEKNTIVKWHPGQASLSMCPELLLPAPIVQAGLVTAVAVTGASRSTMGFCVHHRTFPIAYHPFENSPFIKCSLNYPVYMCHLFGWGLD